MVKVGKWIAKHRVIVLILALLLTIPSAIGVVKTRVNYDLLSYLPEHLETVKGQDILVDEYGMGSVLHGSCEGHGIERRPANERKIQ